MLYQGGANSSQVLSPCPNTTWGCSYACGYKFKVDLGVLQLSDAGKAQLGADTTTGSSTGSTQTTSVTTISTIKSAPSTQDVTSTSTSAGVCVPQSSVAITAALVGVTIGVPLAIGLIATILLLLHEKNKNRHLINISAATKGITRAGLVPPPPSPATRVTSRSSPYSIYLPIQSNLTPDQLPCYEMPDPRGERLAQEMLCKTHSHEMP